MPSLALRNLFITFSVTTLLLATVRWLHPATISFPVILTLAILTATTSLFIVLKRSLP